MMPSFFSEGGEMKNSSTNAIPITKLKVRECPSGTVLIQRTKKNLNPTMGGAIN
ncbi:hypothetical protein QJS04_geneDACA023110 [Acorus gramineus]|uniref:Uncharacterized protein n=1 Tax=Acorus gramineus TaxID=55184 RepID=A0AAV9A1P9_ACOGR|nr:hypothetical protein QJS04_geneDACA023110 [Acorus gramineus]